MFRRISFVFVLCTLMVPFGLAANSETPTVDGIAIDGFDPNRTEYEYYLPFDAKETPTVKFGTTTAVVDAAGQTATLDAGNKTYQIVFKRLPKLDLFLCVGQSNMAGRGPMDESKGDKEKIPNVYLFTPNGNWEPATNPLNRYSTVRKDIKMQQISPAYGFAKKLAEQTQRPIGLVVNAKGGTSIGSWTKGNKDGLYEAALDRALAAKKWGEYKAILWHQGEGNSRTAAVAAYPNQLRKMVGDFRNDLGDKDLFFVAGELGRWRKHSDGDDASEEFNTMIHGIDNFLDRSAWVSAEGLTPLKGDIKDPHFDRPSQLTFGERYADAVFEVIYRSK